MWIDVDVSDRFHVGILIDGDLEVPIGLAGGLQIGASVPVVLLLGSSPLLGLEDLLIDDLPFRAVRIASDMKVINVTAHGSEKNRSAFMVALLLGEPGPKASLVKDRSGVHFQN